MDSSAPNNETSLDTSTVDTKWCTLCGEYVEYGHTDDPANPDNYDSEEQAQ